MCEFIIISIFLKPSFSLFLMVIKFVTSSVVHEHYDYGLITNKDKNIPLTEEYLNPLFLGIWLVSQLLFPNHPLFKISLHDLFCQYFSSLLYVYLDLFSLPFKIKWPIQVLKNFCGMVTQWLFIYFTFYNIKVSLYLLSKKIKIRFINVAKTSISPSVPMRNNDWHQSRGISERTKVKIERFQHDV